jgi:phospholipid N-methyltransferase
MPSSLQNYLTFFTQFRKRFETTGAIAPSSPFLAAAMTRYLAARNSSQPARILEIGPGTGPVTNRIIQLLNPHDQLHLVELNPDFVNTLNQRFNSENHWIKAKPQTTIHQTPLQNYHAEAPFDFIISGLPLNNFPAQLVNELVDAYFKLLKPGGTLSYFEYMFVRPVRKRITRGPEQQRITQIDQRLAEQCRKTRIHRDNVWINLPPAWVQHHQTPPAPQ